MHCTHNLLFIPIVTIYPPGPFYFPILTQRNFTSSVEGGILTSIIVLFSDKDPASFVVVAEREIVSGIVVTPFLPIRILISVNSNDTSIIGIKCEGILQSSTTTTTRDDYTLNLTIYGECFVGFLVDITHHCLQYKAIIFNDIFYSLNIRVSYMEL